MTRTYVSMSGPRQMDSTFTVASRSPLLVETTMPTKTTGALAKAPRVCPGSTAQEADASHGANGGSTAASTTSVTSSRRLTSKRTSTVVERKRQSWRLPLGGPTAERDDPDTHGSPPGLPPPPAPR